MNGSEVDLKGKELGPDGEYLDVDNAGGKNKEGKDEKRDSEEDSDVESMLREMDPVKRHIK